MLALVIPSEGNVIRRIFMTTYNFAVTKILKIVKLSSLSYILKLQFIRLFRDKKLNFKPCIICSAHEA